MQARYRRMGQSPVKPAIELIGGCLWIAIAIGMAVLFLVLSYIAVGS